MDYLSKAKELRKKVPIPIMEAIDMLKKNDSDLALCEQIFKNNKILEICQQTGCSEAMAWQRFTDLRFDTAKTVRSIQEELYDRQYQKPIFLTREKLDMIYEWLKCENFEGLDAVLASENFETVIDVLRQMKNMTPLYKALVKAHERYIFYFEKHDLNVEEYVKRTNYLRMDKVYDECRKVFEMNIGIFERELERHDRNI